jgi:Holliday junction DNA helicase RuvA
LPAPRRAGAEAQVALVNLGYKPAEITKMLRDLDEHLSTEDLIREALRRVHRSGEGAGRRDG